MADEPIPMWDGEVSGTVAVPQEPVSTPTSTVRSRRQSPRTPCTGVALCFTPELPTGMTENVECPVVDKSAIGFAIVYDRPLAAGVRAQVAYMTVGHQPVRIGCAVRHCAPREDGYYLLGIKLDRLLNFEEKRLARSQPGRPVVPGIKPRKLRAPTSPPDHGQAPLPEP
jgi:hypothetical protein